MNAKMKMKTRVKVAHYVVRSSVHIMNLDNAISGLLTKERFIDVTLACDGHRFHCHRLVLAACSPLFEELFTDNPGTHPIVIIPGGIKSSTLKLLIDFMYKGQTQVSQVGLKALMESAELLQVIGLQYAETEFKEYFEEEVEEDTNLENNHLLNHTNHDLVDKEIVQEPETQPEMDHDMENQQMTNAIMDTTNECETSKEQDEMSKQAIADIIQNDDSQHVATDSKEFTSTETPVIVMNGSTHTLNTTDTVDRIQMEVNTNEKTVEKINNADKCHQTFATQVTTMPRIRVKPAIKLINLFQLRGRPGVDNRPPDKIPWTYIHIPTTTPINQATPKATITEMPYTSTQVLPNDLPPLETLPNHVENDAQATTSKSVEEVVPPSSSSSSSLPSFLKFNSSSMAISVTNLDRNDTQEQVKFNMPTQPEVNTSAPMEATEQSVAPKCFVKDEPASNFIELGETRLCEADFPMFYAMIKKERDEAAQFVKEKKEEIDTAEPIAVTEAENIICQPSVSYICNNVDDDNKEIDFDENEAGVCIDYDRLLAETYGNEAEQLMQHLQAKPKKASRKRQMKPPKRTDDPRYILPNNLAPANNDCFKIPAIPPLPRLLTLPGIHAGFGPEQLFFSHTDDKGKIIFHKDNSVFNTVSSTRPPNEGVTHSPQTVILRNPRCNQPRHYSTDSLFNALMAVKYGESIYRASRMHEVPRKTLRNWMKRWDIKSQFPMPKQLENAAKKKRMTQDT